MKLQAQIALVFFIAFFLWYKSYHLRKDRLIKDNLRGTATALDNILDSQHCIIQRADLKRPFVNTKYEVVVVGTDLYEARGWHSVEQGIAPE